MLLITSNGFAIPWVKMLVAQLGMLLQLDVARLVFGVVVVDVATVGLAGPAQAQAHARPRQVGDEERVERDRQPGVGGGLPERVVDQVVERTPVDHRVRPHEHRHHAGQFGHPTDLGGARSTSSGSCMRRYRARTEQAALALGHVVGAPVVVGARLRLGEVDVALALEPQQHRRVQHRQVDVVLVHVLEAGLGVPGRRTRLRVTHLAAEPRARSSSLAPATPAADMPFAGVRFPL